MSPVEMLVLRPASLPPLSRLVLAAAVRLANWEMKARTRRQLSQLDARLLRDVGLDPLSAARESERRFWQD